MRKLLTAIVAATLGLVLLGPAVTAVAATTFDASVSITDFPDPVTPVGGTTIYKIVASAQGVLPLFSATLTSTVSGGNFSLTGTQAPGCTLPADGTSNPTITCSVAPSTASSVTLYIAIKSVAAGTMTNTAHIEYDPAQASALIDDNPANDNATATTTVTDGPASASYVPPGGTITYQQNTLTVRESATGVVTELENANPNAALCGTVTCKQGLRVLFFENQTYSGRTGIDLNFGGTDPCKGQKLATCKPLYYRKGSTGPVTAMAKCVTAVDTLCWETRTFVASGTSDDDETDFDDDDGSWHLVVRVNSDDPDLLSPVRSLTSGTAPAG